MTPIVNVISDRMAADTDLKAKLGTRIYIGEAPQGTAFPLAILRTAASENFQHYEGSTELAQRTIDVHILHNPRSANAAEEIADRVRLLFDGLQDLDDRLDVVDVENMFNQSESPRDGSEAGPAHYIVELDVHYRHEDCAPIT